MGDRDLWEKAMIGSPLVFSLPCTPCAHITMLFLNNIFFFFQIQRVTGKYEYVCDRGVGRVSYCNLDFTYSFKI